ncbi:hypothetical protein GCM10009535_39930 [Streptomyces thermocarboxydovorans]|uniref:Uncharacterized protein n=1 Tax=Streptomyces thermocarboxydovorans TaxID=59298 RepID=A0ABP3SVL2_9ACTN
MVAVAPPWPGSVPLVPAALAVPAPVSRPAARPATRVPAARRAVPRPRADDDTENEANTEFPSERDPLHVGDGPTSRISGPLNPRSHFGILWTRRDAPAGDPVGGLIRLVIVIAACADKP